MQAWSGHQWQNFCKLKATPCSVHDCEIMDTLWACGAIYHHHCSQIWRPTHGGICYSRITFMVKLACNNMHRINVSISQTRSGYEVINDAAERTMKNAQEVAEVSGGPWIGKTWYLSLIISGERLRQSTMLVWIQSINSHGSCDNGDCFISDSNWWANKSDLIKTWHDNKSEMII